MGHYTGARWLEIAADVRAQIEQGILRPGDKAPSENELAEMHGVSRMTAHRVLRDLEREGLFSPGRGGPRTVAYHRPLTVNLLRRAAWAAEGEAPTEGADAWLGDAQRAGREPTQQIAVMTQQAGADLARQLEIPEGGIVIARRVTRYTGRDPDNQVTFYFPQDIAEGTPLAHPASVTTGSVAWLETKYGKLPQVIEAFPRPPTPAEADQLRIPPGTWVQIVQRTLRTKERPVMTSTAVYQRAVLRIEL